MTNKEKLTRKIIESIHGLPYNEDEEETDFKIDYFLGFPITIGRVMQALATKEDGHSGLYAFSSGQIKKIKYSYTGVGNIDVSTQRICDWKLTKENGQECTIEDQSDETINSLLELFN